MAIADRAPTTTEMNEPLKRFATRVYLSVDVWARERARPANPSFIVFAKRPPKNALPFLCLAISLLLYCNLEDNNCK
jgi:hypothetical protein